MICPPQRAEQAPRLNKNNATPPKIWTHRAGGVALLSLCTAAGIGRLCAAQSANLDAPPAATQPQSTIRTMRLHTSSQAPSPAPATQPAATEPIPSAAPATRPAQSSPTLRTTTRPSNTLADPHDDPDFKALQKALADAPDQPQFILLFCGKYLAHQPPGPLVQEVREVADKTLDEIWWKKIDQLCQRRRDQRSKLNQMAARLALQKGDAEPPAAPVEEKAALERELADTQEQLRDMRYLAEQSPPLNDPTKMDRLRQARDPQVYQWWKSLELQKIADSQGTAW